MKLALPPPLIFTPTSSSEAHPAMIPTADAYSCASAQKPLLRSSSPFLKENDRQALGAVVQALPGTPTSHIRGPRFEPWL